MNTLLLRLAGPMQSWGTQSRFSIRDTGLEPSKSGTIGLLCAALGKHRDENHPDQHTLPTLDELAALRMGVRVDREGVPQTDFHTAGGKHLLGDSYGVIKADGKSSDTVTSYRHYLADADFLVGLESENDALIRRLDEAVGRPCWQLYLGRKSFVPAVPVQVPNGLLLNVALEDALTAFDWPTDRRSNAPERLRLVLEVSPGDSRATEVRHDVPLSFSHRRFTIRYVMTDYVSRPKGGKSCTSPD